MKRPTLCLLLSFMACSTTKDNASPAVTNLVQADQVTWLKGFVKSSVPLSRIVVFGDSLSDTGRLYARTRLLYPPDVYWRSRATNGPVWIDYVSHALDRKTENYAVAGAATGASSWLRDVIIPSVQDQVENYLDDTDERKRSQDLAVLWIGPNNYLADLDQGDVSRAIKELEEVIHQLKRSGLKTFVIGTMPELGGLPAYQKAQAEDRRLRAFTAAHNKALKELMLSLKRQYRKEDFVTFHAYEINQETIDRPKDFGFRNLVQACYRGDLLGRFEDKEEFCRDPSGTKFWDEVHPNTKMHCYYAAQFLADLQDTGMVNGFHKEEALTRCRKL